MAPQKISVVLRDILVLTTILGALFFSFLGNRPLAAPDEGRYVEIPREMVQTGDYLTPHLNGLVYFEKPPLFYWIETLPIRYFGIQEAPLRFPLAFLALLGCLLTYFFVQRLYDRATGLWATGIVGTSLLYNVLGRLITLDMGFSVFLSGALLSFLTATEEPSPQKRRGWMILASFCGAAAVMTKGLAGLVLPGLIVGLWVLLARRWIVLRFLFLPSSILLFLLLIAPWHVLVSLKNPGFLDFYFIHEHVTR
jgi:4-amino-4-deoxy-L-arabinose transferase-like glycosyltransferase